MYHYRDYYRDTILVEHHPHDHSSAGDADTGISRLTEV